MKKGKYIAGGLGLLIALFLFSGKKKSKVSYPLPMKKYKVTNDGWEDVDEKKIFKGGEVYSGIQINKDIVTLYKNGKKYYDAPIEAFPGVPALIETKEPLTFKGIGDTTNNLI